MTSAIFFDFTPYRLKAANRHDFGPVRWWETAEAQRHNRGPWWQQQPARHEKTKPAANRGLFDWLFK